MYNPIQTETISSYEENQRCVYTFDLYFHRNKLPSFVLHPATLLKTLYAVRASVILWTNY